jgi:hypothetical protein
MSDTSQGPGWWLASDGKWYAPELWTGPPAAGPLHSAAPGGAGNPYPSCGYGPYATYGAATVPSTNGLAIASLICSCAELFFLPVFPGIILGFVARSQIRRSNGTQQGDGLALAGIIVGLGWLVLIALGLAIDATKTSNSVVSPSTVAGLTCLIVLIGLIGPFN